MTIAFSVTPDIEAMSTDNELFVTEGNTAVVQFAVLEADPGVSPNNVTWFFTVSMVEQSFHVLTSPQSTISPLIVSL